MDEEEYRFADRFALQQSWRIASDLVRRHPEMTVSRLENPEQIPIIIVHAGPVGVRVQFDLTGGIKFLEDQQVQRIDWLDVFAASDATTTLETIERRVGLGVPTSAVTMTKRSLVYDVIATILALKLDDQRAWQVLPLTLLTSDSATLEATFDSMADFSTAGAAADDYLDEIHKLVEYSADSTSMFRWHEPLWLLLRDLEPVAVLDEAGFAHLVDGTRIDLMRMYESFNCETGPLAAVLLIDPGRAVVIALAMQ